MKRKHITQHSHCNLNENLRKMNKNASRNTTSSDRKWGKCQYLKCMTKLFDFHFFYWMFEICCVNSFQQTGKRGTLTSNKTAQEYTNSHHEFIYIFFFSCYTSTMFSFGFCFSFAPQSNRAINDIRFGSCQFLWKLLFVSESFIKLPLPRIVSTKNSAALGL